MSLEIVKYFFSLLFIGVGVISGQCQVQTKITGLWEVTEVYGIELATPDEAWTEFRADGSYISGNGWKQHSYGRYILTEDSIEMISENMRLDDFGPFSYRLRDDSLFLYRDFEGSDEHVTMVRREERPGRDADRLMGAWQVASSDERWFFRWDGMVIHTAKGTRKVGVYQSHGHRKEINVFWYGDSIVHENYRYDFSSKNEVALSNTEPGKTTDVMVLNRVQ